MIASIHGEVLLIGNDHFVVRVSGMGFKVSVPANLISNARLGDTITLHTQLIVREDSLSLYGFETPEERDFFNLLLAVDGIGPRIALAALSTLSIEIIRKAILSEQADILCRIPGVGKKVAQKIVIYLQGKVGESSILQGETFTDINQDVLEALTHLGYSVVEAQSALQSIPRDAPRNVEDRLRLALQYFSS